MYRLKTTWLPTIVNIIVLMASAFFQAPSVSMAQEKAAQSSEKLAVLNKKESVVFFVFKNYFSNKFPKHKAGILMLNPKKPSGLFLVYPEEGESIQELTTKVKTLVGGMFFHGATLNDTVNVAWTESPLPKHEGITNESGSIFFASDEKQEAQLALYARNYDGTEIVYGYFAGRKKGSKSDGEGRFLDSSGRGAEDFDKFWKSIRESR